MGALRWILRLTVALAGLLAGCFWRSGGVLRGVYGIEAPQHDPNVQITDFSYTPASPAHVGDTLTFTVTTDKPVYDLNILAMVRLGSPDHRLAGAPGGWLEVFCRDDGIAPDATAFDGAYTGSLALSPDYVRAQIGVPLSAQLMGYDGYFTPELSGLPLDIVEGEKE